MSRREATWLCSSPPENGRTTPQRRSAALKGRTAPLRRRSPQLGRPWPASRPRWLVLLLFPGLVGTPTASGAQSVRGTVVDADRGRTIPDAAVFLVDTLTIAVDTATTDSAGRFVLRAPGPGSFFITVRPDGYLSYSDPVRVTGDSVAHRVEMPLLSVEAARTMHDAIEREEAFRLDLDEMCTGPVRPWEAGILVGISRDRATLEPVPRAAVRLEPVPSEGDRKKRPQVSAEETSSEPTEWPRTRLATQTGAYWFCNVPPGRARVVARARGFVADTSYAVIRAGTISWYDALLRQTP